ncbi:MAG: ribonuclease H-like domain-containing protein [Sporolactobacillus sp.]
MSLKQKLKLYKKELRQAQQGARQAPAPALPTDCSAHDQAIREAASELHATLRFLDEEFVLVHREQLPLSEKIGAYSLHQVTEAVHAWQSAPSCHPLSAKGLTAEELLFFDTETTGLSSGAGQMIFLIGLAYLCGEHIELRQYFLPGPGHEAAFYEAFLRDTTNLTHLVTFNGKAFDWPRVKTRHQFVRDQVPRLPPFGHFDLLHASRRLWKRRLDTVGLQDVERAILGMTRAEDVPGKMAPFLYFQFLKKPEPALVKGILEHNREDVLTLITLYTHLSFKILGLSASDDDEMFEIARWFDQVKAQSSARPLFQRLASGSSTYRMAAKSFLARYAKQDGHFEQALDLFTDVIRSCCPSPWHYIQAAKLLEHQFNDYRQAMTYTQQAISLMNTTQTDLDHYPRLQLADCQLRLNRLSRKWKANQH